MHSARRATDAAAASWRPTSSQFLTIEGVSLVGPLVCHSTADVNGHQRASTQWVEALCMRHGSCRLVWHGTFQAEPDFVIGYSNQTYKLIELERPDHLLATKSAHPRLVLTHAAYPNC